jgi:hypothetical protein
MNRFDDRAPIPLGGRRIVPAGVGRLQLFGRAPSRREQLDLVSPANRASVREGDDDLALSESAEVGGGERQHHTPANQKAAATRIAIPATKETRIR